MEKFTWYPIRLESGLKIKTIRNEMEHTLCTIWTEKNGREWATINDVFVVIPLGDCFKACSELEFYGYFPVGKEQNESF